MPSVQPGHDPVWGGRSRSGNLQCRMMVDHLLQHDFLLRLDLDEKDVLAFLKILPEAAEVGIRHLDTEKATFPGTETQQHDRQEDKGHPSRSGCSPPQQIGATEHQYGKYHTDGGTNLPRVDDILLHERGHVVQVMSLDIGILFAEHMNLLGADALGLQLLLNGFKIVEIVTGVVVPIHHVPPISLSFSPPPAAISRQLQEEPCLCERPLFFDQIEV